MIPLPVGQVGDIELLIKAHHGLIVLDAADEQRADVLFEYVADRMRLPFFVWKDGIGLSRVAAGMRPIMGTETLMGCLKHISASGIAYLELKKIERTRPLSVTMAENVEALRIWARERAVPAQ